MQNNLSCPVDLVTINEKQPRIVALLVAVLIIVFSWTHLTSLLILVIIDFFLRAFKFGKYSPLSWIANQTVRGLKWKGKQVDVAPKRFAAKLGLILSLCIFISYSTINNDLYLYITIILLFFAFLESIFGICVGCILYQLLRKIGWIK